MKIDEERMLDVICNGLFDLYDEFASPIAGQIADYLISKGVTIPVMCEECVHHKESDGFHFCKALGIYSPDDTTFFCKYGKRGD